MVQVMALLVVVGAVAWMLRRPSRTADAGHDRDDDELHAAEREVRDLPSHATPDDAGEHLPDWGPGAPKH